MTSPDPRSALPESWSDSAATTYIKIRSENPHLNSASLSSLYEACSMLADADAMKARIAADGLVVLGSQGQPVAHPLIGEARLARVQALAALKPLGAGAAGVGSAASRAGTALVSARYNRSAK